ncbi:hypothetical protein C8E87_2616 [Paractinoplanes brasiliensis]|uniref:XRE family transcriptional regulator n=3 Tax=Paractinoplanes brasiliensis TaxID=52695 RepID=A0A4R6JV12_9ACTN|nr:hypothetical protein C8E87_2616 [Actinoplanes brasiliensis]
MPERRSTLLAMLIGRDDRTLSEVIAQFERCARENGEDATLSVRTLRRWLSGDVRTEPRPSQRRVARSMWGFPMSDLLAPAPPEMLISPTTGAPVSNLAGTVATASGVPSENTGEYDSAASTLERQIAMATRRAARFTTFAEIDNVGPEAIAQLQDDVVHLANAYIHDPLVLIMGDIIDTQETVFQLLEGSQKPTFARDLYMLAGVVSGMIAKASHDLGRTHEAMTHARTLYVCAENADHQGLRAWARGLQSLIAYWAGRPVQAVRYARSGIDTAHNLRGSVGAWLPALEARAWAAMSHDQEAIAALNAASDSRTAHEPDDLDSIGGILGFPAAKQHYYAAGAYVHLNGSQDQAETAALASLSMYENGNPQDRSFSDEAGARAELALARVHGGELEGAREALAPLLALAPDRRIGGIVASAERVHQALGAKHHVRAERVKGMRPTGVKRLGVRAGFAGRAG